MRGALRYWLPFVAGLGCMIASLSVGPLAAFILFFAGVGLMLDGATALFAKATRAGGLRDNHQ